MARRKRKEKQPSNQEMPPDQAVTEVPVSPGSEPGLTEAMPTISEPTESDSVPPDDDRLQNGLSTEERVHQIRGEVQVVVQKLLDREGAARTRLKDLESRLKPLHAQAQKIREAVNLKNPHIVSMWKVGKTAGKQAAAEIQLLQQQTEQNQQRCEVFELAIARHAFAEDVHTIHPARQWEGEVNKDQTDDYALEQEILEWIYHGEQRYFGTDYPPEFLEQRAAREAAIVGDDKPLDNVQRADESGNPPHDSQTELDSKPVEKPDQLIDLFDIPVVDPLEADTEARE